MDTPPKNNPPEDAARRAGRAKMMADLQVALALATQLNQMTSQMFPEAAKDFEEKIRPGLASMSIEEKLALGEQNIAELKEIAFKVAPDVAIDLIEAELPTDTASEAKTTELMARLRTET